MLLGAGIKPRNHLVVVFQSIDIWKWTCDSVALSVQVFFFDFTLHNGQTLLGIYFLMPSSPIVCFVVDCLIWQLSFLMLFFCCIHVFQCFANGLKIKFSLPLGMEVVSRFDHIQFENGVKT